MNDIEILRSFAILNRTFLSFFSSSLIGKGISYSEGVILANIGSRPGTNQDALVLELVIDKAAVARAVKVLRAKGHVRVKRSADDRRANVLMLSASGEKLLRFIQTMNRKWLAAVTTDLSAAQRRSFFEPLGAMVARARAQASSPTSA